MYLPNEIWILIFEFDITYHKNYENVMRDIHLLTTKKLAQDYFDGPTQHWPTYFRFFQNGVWHTAKYTEIIYNKFDILLYNETTGSFCRHLHTIPDIRCL